MKLNQKGFTILEVLVALAMIVTVGSLFSLGFLNYQAIHLKAVNSSIVMKQINNLVESIRPNLQAYQINFDSNTQLSADNLPMAWNKDYIGRVEDCPDCPGRLGYTIQPTTQSGLFLVNVMVTHKEWKESEYYQTYVSIK
ncbi:MAG: prepilin-type N-terminal cleavage/methylation domain-containing protein [Bdellovibrionales bacterium]|nr:prepilin-type N-terminal cleavage/methylation domain-containing protein [Bdellovibrionales bacterium]